MGGAKREMDDRDAKLAVAIDIAVKAGALATCPSHDDVYVAGKQEDKAAYAAGTAMLAKGELGEVFDSRKEMTDFIQEALNDNSGSCYLCDKWKSE